MAKKKAEKSLEEIANEVVKRVFGPEFAKEYIAFKNEKPNVEGE